MTQELDLKVLRKVAEQATPGEWEVFDPNEGSGHSPLWCVANDEFHNPSGDEESEWVAVEVHVGDKADADHIATFDPPTVLALLTQLEQAQAQVARVREVADAWKSRGEHDMEYSKTIPQEVGEAICEGGAELVNSANLIYRAVGGEPNE